GEAQKEGDLGQGERTIAEVRLGDRGSGFVHEARERPAFAFEPTLKRPFADGEPPRDAGGGGLAPSAEVFGDGVPDATPEIVESRDLGEEPVRVILEQREERGVRASDRRVPRGA